MNILEKAVGIILIALVIGLGIYAISLKSVQEKDNTKDNIDVSITDEQIKREFMGGCLEELPNGYAYCECGYEEFRATFTDKEIKTFLETYMEDEQSAMANIDLDKFVENTYKVCNKHL